MPFSRSIVMSRCVPRSGPEGESPYPARPPKPPCPGQPPTPNGKPKVCLESRVTIAQTVTATSEIHASERTSYTSNSQTPRRVPGQLLLQHLTEVPFLEPWLRRVECVCVIYHAGAYLVSTSLAGRCPGARSQDGCRAPPRGYAVPAHPSPTCQKAVAPRLHCRCRRDQSGRPSL